jgi:hypothetical protein
MRSTINNVDHTRRSFVSGLGTVLLAGGCRQAAPPEEPAVKADVTLRIGEDITARFPVP